MIYVIIQFISIALLIIMADFTKLLALHYIILICAMIIGLLAVFNMQLKNINILPELKNNHILITTGVYKYLRHPMYLAVLLFSLALLLTNLNIISLLVYLTLIIDLLLKSKQEERYLNAYFNNYANYKQKVGGFFPRL